MRGLMPGKEPRLLRGKSGPRKGKIYYVAETRLVGKERDYLNRCIDSNWISSRGPFIPAFERAFAAQAGCDRYLVKPCTTDQLVEAKGSLGDTAERALLLPALAISARQLAGPGGRRSDCALDQGR